ncbi:MAG: helix-turn-helix domain-containing protein [Planctomycetota bacterium]|jgi:excisionase family DNA binding protein
MTEESSAEQRVYTTGQVATLCGVKTITVVRWIKRGELEAYSLPGRGDRRIPREALLRFLERNNLPVPPAIMPPSLRVLILGKEALKRRAMIKALREQHIEVRVLSESFQAGMEIEARRPDLLIVDLSCSSLDGLGIIRWVRQCKHLEAIQILAMKALSDRTLKRAHKAGADQALRGMADALTLAGFLGQRLAPRGQTAFA